MKTKKLASILLTALLVTQIFNFPVLAAEEQPENLIQTAVSEYLTANEYKELTDENVFGVLVQNETGEKVSDTSYVSLIDGDDSTLVRSAVNSGRNTFRLSVNLQRKRMFNRVVFYEDFVSEKGATSIKSFEISVANTYVNDGAAFESKNPKGYGAFTDVKTLTAADYTYTTEPLQDGTGMKHTIVLNNFANNQYVILQTVATAEAFGTTDARYDKPRFVEFELYYDEPENIVQAAAEQYLAAINEDTLTEENVYDTYNAEGTLTDNKGLLLKNQTGLDNGAGRFVKSIDGINNSTTNFMRTSTTSTGSGTKFPQIAINLQKVRRFNKIVFYESSKDSAAVSGVTPPTSKITDGIKIAVADSYTDNGVAFAIKTVLDDSTKDTTVFENYDEIEADEYTYTVEPVGDYEDSVLKHTVILNEAQSRQFFILQFSYKKGAATDIMEFELYYEPILGEVTVTEADGTVTAEVKGSGLTSDYANTTLILAEYEGDVLKNVKLDKVDTITAGNATITASLSKVDGRTYKAFLLKSLSSLIPLQEATPLAN